MPRPKHVSEQITWSDELREKLPDVPGVDIQTDGLLDPQKVARAMQSQDWKLRSVWNTQKLLATVAWHSGWGSSDDAPYTMTTLSMWFMETYDLYLVPTDLRMMVVTTEATYWYGDEVRKWIDSFPQTVQHEIARQILKVLKRNPVHMDADELGASRPIIEKIMKAVPRGTTHAMVITKLQVAGLLPTKGGGVIGTPEGTQDEFDLDREILKRLRLSDDGMIAGMYMPRFMKQGDHMESHLKHQIETVQAVHEGLTRDQALQMVIDAGIAALGLGKKEAA